MAAPFKKTTISRKKKRKNVNSRTLFSVDLDVCKIIKKKNKKNIHRLKLKNNKFFLYYIHKLGE